MCVTPYKQEFIFQFAAQFSIRILIFFYSVTKPRARSQLQLNL